MSHQEKLEVIIDKIGSSKYSVTVSWGGVRESSDFKLPYSREKLEDLTRLVGEIDETSGRPKASQEQLRDVGVKLYESMFPNERIRDIVSRCLTTGRGSLELQLRYKEHDVGSIPWELLHDGKMQLVASAAFNLVRVVEIHEPFTEISVRSPLKILVVIARPLDQPSLEMAPPKSQIMTELDKDIKAQKIVVHFLTPPTYDELVKWLGRGYDIVQFYGHGGIFGDKGCLAFEDELGLTKLVSAEELAVGLRRSGVQLVVLCACHSGAAPSKDVFTGVAQSIVGAGVPAIVGWGYAVPVDTALSFMEQFYAALAAQGKPSVRGGVAQARRALFPRGTAHFLVLFERTSDDRLHQTGAWDPATLPSPFSDPKHNLDEALGIHNLIVGRLSELVELSKALASQETVIALWGYGGIGKTALAVRGVYDRFIWRFPDGVWYVELQGGRTLDTILSELSTHMQLPHASMTEDKERLVLAGLAQTKTLIIMNNFEDVETDPGIARFLSKVRAPSKVFLTTRHEPQVMAWRKCELQTMPAVDASQLFLAVAERAGRPVQSSEMRSIGEICRRLDFYPIAVVYVAGSLTRSTVEDVLSDLDENPPSPIEAAFEYAYGKLSPDSREILARLSILDGPFRLEAIEALSMPSVDGLQVTDWRRCKDELRSSALLSLSRDLFSMLRTTRLIAARHLSEPRKWHNIAASYFMSQRNFDPLQAFDHLRQAERWREAVELINNAHSRFIQYGLGGEFAPRLQEAANIAAEKLGNLELQSQSLGYAGYALLSLGKYKEALANYQEALRIQRFLLEADQNSVVRRANVATTLNNLAALLSLMGMYDKALKPQVEALETYRTLALTDPNNVERQSDVAMSMGNLGSILRKLHKSDEALKHSTEALEAWKKLVKTYPSYAEYRSNAASAMTNLGSLKSDMDRPEEGIELYKEALETYGALSRADSSNVELQSKVARAHANFGNLLLRQDRFDEALEHYTEALETRRALLKSDPSNLAYQSDVGTTHNSLADLLLNMNRLDEALEHYTEALETRRALLKSDPSNLAYQSDVGTTHNDLGILLNRLRRFDEALEHYTEALETRRALLKSDPSNLAYQSDVGMTLNNFGGLLSDMRRFDEALNYFAEALGVYQSLQTISSDDLVYKGRVTGVLLNTILAYYRAGDLERAISTAQSLIDQCEHMDYPMGASAGYLRLADLQLTKKNTVLATRALNEALRLAKENSLSDISDGAQLMRGRIFLVEGETSKAFCCFSDACIISLQHGRKIHNAIVNEVLNILRSLVNEGEKKTARQLANHLVKTWKEQGHDETTQFTELVENEVRDARSETS